MTTISCASFSASSGLSQGEIERMVKEAEEHADEDTRKREEVEGRNNAENAAFSAEKLVQDNADKVPDDLKQEIEGKIAAVRSALQGEDTAQISTAVEELQASLQKVGELVYSQTPSADAPPEGEEAKDETDTGDTVEGEYREV